MANSDGPALKLDTPGGHFLEVSKENKGKLSGVTKM